MSGKSKPSSAKSRPISSKSNSSKSNQQIGREESFMDKVSDDILSPTEYYQVRYIVS